MERVRVTIRRGLAEEMVADSERWLEALREDLRAGRLVDTTEYRHAQRIVQANRSELRRLREQGLG